MDVVGSEIGQKMRSAIKAKLTELGCYVDDELPDYVMVMVANKRTRTQMEDDLQLFLGDNTELFVNWLHQVLKKLQEVTIAPLKGETEKSKEKSKDKKVKEKKDKGKLKKTESLKKAKKKDKEKEKLRKKEEKKSHKSKKKSKHHEMIRPNIPPLLMNIEKESEPSITDVFAGQILKNHGIIIDTPKEEKVEDKKPIVTELKRPIKPIIDPATIDSQPEQIDPPIETALVIETAPAIEIPPENAEESSAPREEQIKEINEIEAKIQGLKQKLAEQLDSMSDDEDFLNIRTEAEELMNDFAEDVFQEISSQTPAVSTPPIVPRKSPTPPPKAPEPIVPETLPQIELKLPKRPVRERLGAREEKKEVPPPVKEKEKRTESPERFTPEREPDFWGKARPAKSRLGDAPEPPKRISVSEDSDKSDGSMKKVSSKVSSAAPERVRAPCASVVRVRPRPRVASASSLLLRAVADAHKSLLNIPPKVDAEQSKVKRALVLPMRRCVEAQNIVIQIPTDRETDSRRECREDDMRHKLDAMEKEEYIPAPLSKKIINTDYVPSRRSDRTASRKDDTLIIETINIHNTTVGKDKDTQFIVTMDGFNPNAFLAKKLKTEGILDDVQDKPKEAKSLKPAKSVLLIPEVETDKKATKDEGKNDKIEEDRDNIQITIDKDDEFEEPRDRNEKKEVKEKSPDKPDEVAIQKKRLSDTSEDSDTQVIIKKETEVAEKRKMSEEKEASLLTTPPVKKRKASPIVFDVAKKEPNKEVSKARERTESASSDNHITVTTAPNTHKYDSLPPLSQTERKLVWCRSFPLCRFGASCAFQHPRCKFLAGCTRRGCVYAHAAAAPAGPAAPHAAPPALASHVVPAANYKSISATIPSVCKYYPNCANPTCHFYHPKPCRYGKACVNKLECNFYHNDVPAKFRYPV